ncbi:hypothetical protein [Peptostreptococcus stomatis]|uniref:hypothetical protein n=1 Tax=Peptostreptococcus stomatis TaxID=341694 RepID=UPI0026ECCD71|nr:hypothetical protein [Peptostreptococcus stomatis]
MSWRNFEEECTEYLNEKYGTKFEQQGESDSTVSDILYRGKDKAFYIEAKMPNAQCGQFVLLPDLKNGIFKYSTKNKTSENEYTRMIVNFMDSNFDEFCNSGTAGSDINMPKSVFYNWIINYYKEKGAEFFITKDRGGFLIFPIDQFSNYFDVTAKYRKKKSGSSSLNNSNTSDFEYAMSIAGIDFSFSGLDIISDSHLDGIKVNGNKYDYLLKENGSNYKVRKLSNTRNANVIFSIELMDYDIDQQKKDLIQFENAISK